MVPPMARRLTSVHLKSELETQKFAFALSTLLQKEDILLLSGEIGAGKSFVARAIIQSLQAEPEDVPSPTFTLVQTYDTRLGEVWHADLYRLSSIDDVEELGLLEAFDTAICLIEWPDIISPLVPERALWIEIATLSKTQERRIDMHYEEHHWSARLERLNDC